MTPESWSVLTVAAGFFLLGIAGSPLAWVALHHRRSRIELEVDERARDVSARIAKLESRLQTLAATLEQRAGDKTQAPSDEAARGRYLAPHHVNGASHRRADASEINSSSESEQALIAVPSLRLAAPNDRTAIVNGLTERYQAIWALADQGSSPDVIARATGQPVGQIELILGLRRQIEGTRHAIPHAPHV